MTPCIDPRSIAALGVLLAPVPALAQSINIDIGAGNAAPAALFGAAAGQAGTWNNVVALPVNVALQDIAGAATGATIGYVGNGGARLFDDPATAGNDELLLDDILDIGPAPATGRYTIGPLTDGIYDVYVYAISPDTATDKTSVSIRNGAAQLCTGAFAGYALGATHVKARLWLGADESIPIDASSVAGSGNGSVNGIQLVRNPANLALTRKLNIDVGTGSPPANTYGAAAGQAGTWNVVSHFFADQNPLVDLTGGAIDARIQCLGVGAFGSHDNAATNGDDQALMDDKRDVGLQGATRTWTIGPMPKGTYDVYTYAWDPEGTGAQTEVKVRGGAAAAALACGAAAWPGFVVNQTHVVERVVLAATANIDVDVKSLVGNGSINGFQIVEVPQAAGCGGESSGGALPASGTGDGSWPGTMPSSPLSSPASITPPAGATKIVRVELNGLSHTWVGDLQLVLQAPDSSKHNLLHRPAFAGSGFGCGGDLLGDYAIYESFGSALAAGCPSMIPGGDYQQHFGVWPSGANGISNTPLESIPISAGNWTLHVYDWASGDVGSLVSWELCFDGESGPTAYCTAGTTSNGCVATIAGSGNPDVGHSSACLITVDNVEGQKNGLVFYGLAPHAAPWCAGGGSYLCVKSPTQRIASLSTGGNANLCNGSLAFDWNAYQLAHPSALGQPWAAGTKAYVQAWFRDPPACKTTNLSNALELTYQP